MIILEYICGCCKKKFMLGDSAVGYTQPQVIELYVDKD